MAKRHVPTRHELPGGRMITFRGYVPDKTCHECKRVLEAGMFLTHTKTKNGAQRFEFHPSVCAWCRRENFERIWPLKVVGVFVTDENKSVGWRERDRRGPFGPSRRFDQMQFRRVQGVVRPQPKFDRRSYQVMAEKPKAAMPAPRLLLDPRRSFSKRDRLAAAAAQGNLCGICQEPFTEDNPPVGGHDYPHTRGGSSRQLRNCIALHARCNARMRDMSFDEFREWERGFRELPFDDPDGMR